VAARACEQEFECVEMKANQPTLLSLTLGRSRGSAHRKNSRDKSLHTPMAHGSTRCSVWVQGLAERRWAFFQAENR
jgi:hypothetical protein